MAAGRLVLPSGVEQFIEQVADLAVSLDREGMVTGVSVSPENPTLGCLDHWIGRDFRSFLNVESRAKFDARMKAIAADPGSAQRPLELNHVDNAAWEFPIRYTVHPVGLDGGYLLVGRDLQPIAEIQQRLVREQVARERDQERMRGLETRYRVVMEAAETGMALVDPESGRIADINNAGAKLLGSSRDTLVGNAFVQAFQGRRRGEFNEALQAAASAEEPLAVEAVALRNLRPLRIVPDRFRASGEIMLLCRIAPLEEDEGASAETAQYLSALFEATSDAIVLTDGKGIIRDANESFLVLADAAQIRDVQGRSLADFLSRGTVDLKLILESTAQTGRIRSYAARVQSLVGTLASVEVSAVRLRGRSDLGLGFVIRESSPAEPGVSGDFASAMSEDAMRNVMDLVGTATLKELVSATTDVVEKMCIETAVRLTGNNRMAAAEMLGLSRQSLYVKLRKFGLIDSNSED